MSTKSWSDLTHTQRRWVILGGIVQLTLQAATLRDLRRRPAPDIRGSRRLWVCASFINTVGPATYFVFGRRSHTKGGS